MRVLALDTSTTTLGLATLNGDAISTWMVREGLNYGRTLAPRIEQAIRWSGFEPHDLDLAIVTIGPGSFTGIRIGLATTLGLTRGSGAQTLGVPTLDLYAFPYPFFDGVVVPVIDARKRRVYAALYEKGRRISEYLDVAPHDLARRLGSAKVLLTGPYAGPFRDAVKHESDAVLDAVLEVDPLHNLPNPAALLRLGIQRYHRDGPTQALAPIYLRVSEAEEKTKGG